MDQAVRDSFLDLDKHRQLLEERVENLRASLRLWNLWELEYEGLKEEILAADPALNRDQLLELGSKYQGGLLKKKEIDELLGVATPRTPAQVVHLLEKRTDYVQQNVRTLESQIEVAENKLAAATIIITPDVRNEEGLPLTEIMEELDDDGNIVSSHMSTPGSTKPQLLEILQKASVKNPPLSPDLSPDFDKSSITPKTNGDFEEPSRLIPSKKGVQFTPDTKPGPDTKQSQTAKRIEQIIEIAKQQDNQLAEPPIIPTNESPEDAALRRDMLKYGMSEVGAVVAELDLEEGSDWSDDDYDEDDLSSEDEFGRSTHSVIDAELRQQMLELERRLGVRAMENIGKEASDYDIVEEGIGRVTISGKEETTSPNISGEGNSLGSRSQSATETKKSVRFSEDLDIAPAPKPQKPAIKSSTKISPVRDIIERSAPVEAIGSTSMVPQKMASRFKSSKALLTTNNSTNGSVTTETSRGSTTSLPLYAANSSATKPFSLPIQYQPAEERVRVVPTGPEGITLASTIVERDVPIDNIVTEPDGMDSQLLHQEISTEYHKIRNRIINRQGGFLKEKETEFVPFTEEEGGPKKLSRFKAARLARS